MVHTPSTAVPGNRLKAALAKGERQIGLWLSAASPALTEIATSSGLDWVLIDMEHSPNDLGEVAAQLRASGFGPASAVVRPPSNDAVAIKRLLDLGAQTLLVPMVDRPDQAEAAVRAMRYPPRGMRGFAGTTRANRYGESTDYVQRCEAELCLIIQAESREALANLDGLAAVDGVDAVFIGAADLAMDMQLGGDVSHPQLWDTIARAAERLRASGKPFGILLSRPADLQRATALGFTFLGMGSDVRLFSHACRQLAGEWGEPGR